MIDNWYDDPSGAQARRYWRGGRWTNHVQGRNGEAFTDELSQSILNTLPAPAAMAAIPADVAPGVPYDPFRGSSSTVRYGRLDPSAPIITQPVKSNGCAVASMVLGILGLLWMPLGLFGILPIYFGKRARHQIAYARGREGGGGMATAGIVMGWIQVAIVVLLIIAVMAALGRSNQ